MRVSDHKKALLLFVEYFGSKPCPDTFPAYANYWEQQFKVYTEGFLDGMQEANKEATKEIKAAPNHQQFTI